MMEFEKTLKYFIKACNERSIEDIYRYTSKNTKILWPQGTGFDDNFRRLFELDEDLVPFVIEFNEIELTEYDYTVFGNSVVLTGYAQGNILFPSKPEKTGHNGTWRVSMFWHYINNDWKLYQFNIIDIVYLKYLSYFPKNYRKEGNKKWPLVLFLHGSNERGSNLDIIRRTGLPEVLEKRQELFSRELSFITICPQCPAELRWYMLNHSLKELLDKTIERYSIDKNRVFLTGNSMGGNGVWSLASEFPDLFAAIAPICGRTDYVKTSRLKRIPTWVFHSKEDDVIPIRFSREIVNKLKKDNINLKFTIYPEAKHDCWSETYKNPELYKWFLSHSLSKRLEEV